MDHLDRLEAEAIYIMRETVAVCEHPVMLYSIGKDSSVMLHLALKAFYPEKPPFPFLHINTTWKFKEMIEFRNRRMKECGLNFIEYINEDGLRAGVNPFTSGAAYTDIMMRKNPAQRRECAHLGMRSRSGIRSVSARRCGSFII